MSKRRILVVDDVEINRELIRIIFEDQFDVITAEDGAKAIRLIDQYSSSLSIIILDLIMPKVSGLDVLAHIKDVGLSNLVPVIVVTAETTRENVVKAYAYGVADIISKPISSSVITKRALSIIEKNEHRLKIEKLLEHRTKELEEAKIMVERENEFLINALSSVVEFRGLESGQHISRIREFTRIMLETWSVLYPEDGLRAQMIDRIAKASSLHDIGKIAIPDKILLKPGKLTDAEFEIMKTHTVNGCAILERFKQDDSAFYHYVYDICRSHHERNDGSGYPDGLRGDEIPIWAQIVSVIDVYDALVSPRIYKEPFPIESAFRMILSGECGSFSVKVLKCFDDAKDELVASTRYFDKLDSQKPILTA